MRTKLILSIILAGGLFSACMKDKTEAPTPLNPDTAGDVMVDRFSSTAGHLFVRNGDNLPGANEAIDFDNTPGLITKGFGPAGQTIQYYNFDVMSTTPAPIYALFREGEDMPVSGQLNIVDVIPGEANYNDFWLVNKVTVPSDYVANTVTSYQDIIDKGYMVTPTTTIVNCPIVPKGSVATKRFTNEDPGLTRGWYDHMVVYYFNFSEKMLSAMSGMVPTSDIYVSFNINPDQPMGGPPSGFKTEDDMPTGQAHNVAETIPTDDHYSPLWDVNIYDNADFSSVWNLSTAQAATIKAMDAAIVNCPIVSVQ